MSRSYYMGDAELETKSSGVVNMLVFLLLGLGIGAALALLFAPDEGEKTRERITDSLDSGVKATSDAGNDALDRLEKEYQNLRKEMDKLISNIK
ncbi:YtxH domain-containing protein [Aggregatilinea lenta]|uniref:YtxH domain-containing protein n=1 Tax=Aggregatilinea lenta TaxID=913108 RepID=UPI001930EA58|nr:YtxH domain-containing protein [Aggregatilinea lenta]